MDMLDALLARNQLIFENRRTPPAEIATKGLVLSREWNIAQAKVIKPQITSARPVGHQSKNNQRLRPNGSTICFTDASWDQRTLRTGLAWIFKDNQGIIYYKESQTHDFVSSPLMAEALAIRSALQSTATLGISSIEVRSDSLTFIQAINNKQLQKEIYGILADIDHLLSLFVSSFLCFIPRSQNEEADGLAKASIRNYSFV
ncbi:uncharacterized protein LOC108844851 [Raphanus sativus]|uniref:Uncharacterized protein LOC108844851 n=1 Tax=Raphanus sativus TaxID=3726 RepID=A0A6J0MMB9_RAPSA|nr:uncharacterized protein LOC108844851 [Raphanus sativus]